jgi:hypothetical protein
MVVFSSGTAIVALLVGAIAGSFFVSLAMNGRAWLIGWLSGFVTVLALSGMFEYVTWRL